MGRLVLPGDSLLAVVSIDTVEARVALTGAGAARVRAGQVVRLIPYADPSAARVAEVGSVSTASVAQVEEVEARIRIASESSASAWRPGMRGEASVELSRSPLAVVLWWKLRQWVRTDLWL